MNCAWISEDDEMAFSPENQDWVHTQIQNALDKALKGLKPPSGFKKALYVLREWAVLAVNFSIILTLAIFSATQWSAANNRLATERVFQKGTEDRLKTIEQILKELQHPSPLQAFAKMGQAQFSHELGRVADAAYWAQRDGVADSIENIDAIQKKLVALPLNTPEASRVVSSVVNYASFVREKTGLFPNGGAARAKPCNMISVGNGPPNVIMVKLSDVVMDGCGQKLDGLSLKNVTMRNAIITYGGGAINLENVTFVNCLFLISLPTRPTVPAKQLAEEILVKNIGRTPTFTVSVG